MKKHGQRSRIARELGISPQAVTKLVAKGMPLDTADAARRWRAANLHPGRVRPDPGPSPETLLQRAQSMMLVAAAAVDQGLLRLVADDLRGAMRAVPRSHRHRLELHFGLCLELLGPHALRVLRGAADEPAPQPAAIEHGATIAGADGDELDPGEVLYSLVCGEAQIR